MMTGLVPEFTTRLSDLIKSSFVIVAFTGTLERKIYSIAACKIIKDVLQKNVYFQEVIALSQRSFFKIIQLWPHATDIKKFVSCFFSVVLITNIAIKICILTPVLSVLAIGIHMAAIQILIFGIKSPENLEIYTFDNFFKKAYGIKHQYVPCTLNEKIRNFSKISSAVASIFLSLSLFIHPTQFLVGYTINCIGTCAVYHIASSYYLNFVRA
jgi:hypothetical protein